ncbi:MAG: DUF948 domain-containing protein [Nitrososphaera sp.]|nr:DUF948 domain-containing protein [Nitrososphaera sp.]MCI0706623.1 DUF948 domain-containing protein [Ignavibacteriota bacterium]
METLLSVAQLIALVSVSALCVYLIVVLVRVQDVLGLLQRNLADFNEHAKPVLENLHYITEKFRSISAKIDDQVGVVKESLESIQLAVDNVVAFEERLQQWLEEPVFRLVSSVSAFVNGIVSWIDALRGERTK